MRIFDNFELKDYNSYKIKATCKRAFFPENECDLIEIFKSVLKEDIIIIGNGNNIILSKNFYNKSFVILNKSFDKINVSDQMIDAEAGATIFDLSLLALENELTGMEFYYDIPSSVGGAVVMNAGTKEGVTNDILEKVRYLDLNDFTTKELLNHDINFEYRNSFFQKNKNTVILKAWFKLAKGSRDVIFNTMEESKRRRWEMQPRDLPNCGSVFKRPNGYFVGPMIEELGLKGFTIGGAQVSTKHAGFIVNKDNATGEDILKLTQIIKDRVKKRFSIDLEIEQRII